MSFDSGTDRQAADEFGAPEGSAYVQAPRPQPVRINLPGRGRKPWVTWSLLAATIIFYLLQQLSNSMLGTDLLLLYGAKINAAIYAGQFWRLITPVFLHGSILHIAFNMYALYIIGSGLELYYGHTRFTLLYLLSGYAGNVFSLVFTPAPSLGASTAVFGMIAAQGIFIYKNRFLFGKRARAMLGNILFIVLFNLFLGLNPGIDNWGHLGGLIGGAAFAWFAGPLIALREDTLGYRLEDQRTSNKGWSVFLISAAVISAVVLMKIISA